MEAPVSRGILSGYYGQRNAGDDAFVLVCAAALPSVGIERIGVLGAPLPAATPASTTSLTPPWHGRGLGPRLERHRRNAWLRRDAAVLLGGGSTLRDTPSLEALSEMLDRSPRGFHRALGVSLGPFRDATASERLAQLLPRFGFVGVRDEESLALAQHLAPQAPVRLTFDLAVLLPTLYRLPIAPDRGRIGIALCRSAVEPDDLEAFGGVLREALSRRPDLRISLISMNAHPRKGDTTMHRQLARLVGQPDRVALHEYDGSPLRMMAHVASLRGMIAMRLHAAVFAYSLGIPAMLVPYQPKSLGWARMVGHREHLVRPFTSLAPEDLDGSWVDGSSATTLPVAEAVAASRRNFLPERAS